MRSDPTAEVTHLKCVSCEFESHLRNHAKVAQRQRQMAQTHRVAGSNPAPTAKQEGTAEWSATGLENRGMVKHGGSIPLPSSKKGTNNEIHIRMGLPTRSKQLTMGCRLPMRCMRAV